VSTNQIRLATNDRLFIYTDGLVEMEVDNKKDLRFDIINEAVIKTKEYPLDEAVQTILNIVTSKNRIVDDDIAIIALEVC